MDPLLNLLVVDGGTRPLVHHLDGLNQSVSCYGGAALQNELCITSDDSLTTIFPLTISTCGPALLQHPLEKPHTHRTGTYLGCSTAAMARARWTLASLCLAFDAATSAAVDTSAFLRFARLRPNELLHRSERVVVARLIGVAPVSGAAPPKATS